MSGVDRVVSFGPWFLAGGVAPFCPTAGLSASRKVVSSVILPRVESPAHSLSLGTPSGGFWVGTLSRPAANPNVWSGAFCSTGGSAEEVPMAAEMGLDGLAAELCSGLWPGHRPFSGCLCGLCPHVPLSLPSVSRGLSGRSSSQQQHLDRWLDPLVL